MPQRGELVAAAEPLPGRDDRRQPIRDLRRHRVQVFDAFSLCQRASPKRRRLCAKSSGLQPSFPTALITLTRRAGPISGRSSSARETEEEATANRATCLAVVCWSLDAITLPSVSVPGWEIYWQGVSLAAATRGWQPLSFPNILGAAICCHSAVEDTDRCAETDFIALSRGSQRACRPPARSPHGHLVDLDEASSLPRPASEP
jgi:hypothetical protein